MRLGRSAREAQGAAPLERGSPLAAQIALVVAFVALAITGIVTVAWPELRDDSGDEDEASTEQQDAADEAAPPPGEAAGAAAAP